MANKKRLDLLIHERMPDYTRTQIQSWIMQGRVKIEGQVETKAGTQVTEDLALEVDVHEPRYVSRAGLKLEKALEFFTLNVTGFVVLDAGLSTGGFTDCLLKHGAAKVYGVDVGYGQVHEKIRSDKRVVVMERTNLRDLAHLPEPVDMVTLDLSFISILKVIEVVGKLLKPGGVLVTLIKPQFEAGRSDVGKGGIVKDQKVHARVIDEITQGIVAQGFVARGVTPSPILGSSGNAEFLAYFVKN